MLHCKSCGTWLSPDDLFCGQCGHVVGEIREVTNSRDYRRGDPDIPFTPPPLGEPSNPRLMNGEQSQRSPSTPPPLRRPSNPWLSNGGMGQQVPHISTTGSSESTWPRPDVEEYYPTIISSKEQAVDRPVPTLPMAPDPLSMRNSSPSVQGSYRLAPQSAPPVTPAPELGNSAVWSWSPTARVPDVQPVPSHSSMPPTAAWPPEPPPSFFRKHVQKLGVIAIVAILIISSIIGFFLVHQPKAQPPAVLKPAHLMVSLSTLDFGKLPQGVKAVRTIEISNTGERQLTWMVDTGSRQWLTVQKRTAAIEPGSPQQSNNVTVDTSHLPLGDNSAQLVIRSNGGNASVTVKIVVIPPSTKKQPLLNLSMNNFNLGTLAAGTQMTLPETVSNIGTQTLVWRVSPSYVRWLGVYNTNGNISSGGQPETINMIVNTTGLAAGSYQTMMSITSNGGNQNVLISLSVPSLSAVTQQPVTQPPVTQPPVTQQPVTPSPSIAPPLLSVSATSLNFGSVIVNTVKTQALTLSNNGGMPFTWNANSDHPSWLTARPNTGTIQPSSQQTLSVVVNTAGLAATSYSATLSITSGGGDATVAVTVTVVSPPQLCNLAPGSALDFGSVQQGQNSPPSQSLTFSNCGGELLNWTASTQNTAWLSLSSSSGSVNPNQQGSATIQVIVDTSQLQPNSYSATVVISSNDPNNGTEPITVSVTVTAPPTPPPPGPSPTPSPTP